MEPKHSNEFVYGCIHCRLPTCPVKLTARDAWWLQHGQGQDQAAVTTEMKKKCQEASAKTKKKCEEVPAKT
jgi:hypothetical protein